MQIYRKGTKGYSAFHVDILYLLERQAKINDKHIQALHCCYPNGFVNTGGGQVENVDCQQPWAWH